AAQTGVRLPLGSGKRTPERLGEAGRPGSANRRSFTAGGRKRNARTATPARPHKPAFVYRWGAEKERQNGHAGPPPQTGVRLPLGGGKGTPVGSGGARCGLRRPGFGDTGASRAVRSGRRSALREQLHAPVDGGARLATQRLVVVGGDRVGDDGERVARHPAGPGQRLGGGREGVGQGGRRRDAGLLGGDGVVQTARRAAASV